MDKFQGIYSFWSGFGLTAYDETTVPDGSKAPAFPYITFSVGSDNFGKEISLTASVWYRSTTWTDADTKIEQISAALNQPKIITVDGGAVWIKKGQPFAQRIADQSDDLIRRYLINYTVEFLTII